MKSQWFPSCTGPLINLETHPVFVLDPAFVSVTPNKIVQTVGIFASDLDVPAKAIKKIYLLKPNAFDLLPETEFPFVELDFQ